MLSQRAQVGLMILVGVGIFVAGYLWLIQWRYAANRYYYKVNFKKIAWLNKGDLVTIAGVPKGKVQYIRLFPDSVVVGIYVDDYQLLEGARGYLITQGIVGERRIALELGKGKLLPNYSTIPGEQVPGMEDALAAATRLVVNFDSLVSNFSQLTGGTFRSIQRAETSLILTLGDLRKEIRSLSAIMENQATSSGELLKKSLVRVDSVTMQLQQGKGTLGKLMQDDGLYRELENAVQELRALIEDIKKNPQKYIKIKVF